MTDIQVAWNTTREGRWQVADACWEAQEQGEDMEKFGQSVTPPFSRATGYRYARAGRCYSKLLTRYGDPVSSMRLVLFENYFEVVADMDEDDAIEWLLEAFYATPRPTIEEFRELLPPKEKMSNDITQTAKDIERIINRPQFGGDNKLWQIVNKLLRKAVALLREAGGGSVADTGSN